MREHVRVWGNVLVGGPGVCPQVTGVSLSWKYIRVWGRKAAGGLRECTWGDGWMCVREPMKTE